jgi:hypothetical protein
VRVPSLLVMKMVASSTSASKSRLSAIGSESPVVAAQAAQVRRDQLAQSDPKARKGHPARKVTRASVAMMVLQALRDRQGRKARRAIRARPAHRAVRALLDRLAPRDRPDLRETSAPLDPRVAQDRRARSDQPAPKGSVGHRAIQGSPESRVTPERRDRPDQPLRPSTPPQGRLSPSPLPRTPWSRQLLLLRAPSRRPSPSLDRSAS